jgi:hypothetical protein
MDVLKYLSFASTGKPISSIFFSSCTLNKINNLPWNSLLDNSIYFLSELSKIYFSLGMNRNMNSAVFALSSNEVLIPYTNELSVAFFNKTWCLPLWLVGCSLDNPLIIADGLYLGASAFFEHDLFHLSTKLRQLCRKRPFFSCISEQIKLIYQNKHLIHHIKFKAIELTIFYMFHEIGINDIPGDLIANFKIVLEKYQHLPLYSLPVEYELVSSIDIKKCLHFLIELFLKTNINIDFMTRLSASEISITSKHLLDMGVDLTLEYYNINYSNPNFIAEIINDILDNKALLIDNNFNPSKLVFIMRKYTENMQNKLNNRSLDYSTYSKQHKLDKQVLYQLAEDRQNLDFLVCFSESDKTLTSSERCKIACRMAQKGIANCL